MSIRAIYKSPHLRVVCAGRAPPRSARHLQHGDDDREGQRVRGKTIADAVDLTTIGVMSHRSNWHPASEMRQATEIIRLLGINRLLQGKRHVITCDPSMGGYAS